jgi:hypothetical protein
LSLVCALAFLVVTTAHVFHHAEPAIASVAVEISLSGDTDRAPEPLTKKSAVIEHCHGCVMLAVVEAPPAELPVLVSERPSTRTVSAHAYSRPAENPPPIAAI